MILVIKRDATLAQIGHVIELVKTLGFAPHVTPRRSDSRHNRSPNASRSLVEEEFDRHIARR